MPRNAWEVLGVARGASMDEVRQAFRRLAAVHHPDRNPGDPTAEKKFREISAAYGEIAGQADRVTPGGSPGANHSASPYQSTSAFDFVGEFLADILGSLIGLPPKAGAGAGGGAVPRGDDVRVDLSLTGFDAMTGVAKVVSYQKKSRCDNCVGAGAVRNSSSKVCRACGGAGALAGQLAFLVVTRSCLECGGRGSMPDQPCAVCRGLGLVATAEWLRVSVPAGVRDSSRLRFAGHGDQCAVRGISGDLIVDVHVSDH